MLKFKIQIQLHIGDSNQIFVRRLRKHMEQFHAGLKKIYQILDQIFLVKKIFRKRKIFNCDTTKIFQS